MVALIESKTDFAISMLSDDDLILLMMTIMETEPHETASERYRRERATTQSLVKDQVVQAALRSSRPS